MMAHRQAAKTLSLHMAGWIFFDAFLVNDSADHGSNSLWQLGFKNRARRQVE
jgi:hypothetical protein